MRHVAELEILDLNTLINRATNRIGSYMNTEFSNLDLVYQFWGEVTLRLDEQFPLILNEILRTSLDIYARWPLVYPFWLVAFRVACNPHSVFEA